MVQKFVIPDRFEALGGRIIGCAIEVHRALGPGLLEKLYERALVIDLRRAGLEVSQQVSMPVLYRGGVIGEHVFDLVVENLVVLEIKSCSEVHPSHIATVVSYLRIADRPLGYVLNFNCVTLKDGLRRVVNPAWSGFPNTALTPPPVSDSSLRAFEPPAK